MNIEELKFVKEIIETFESMADSLKRIADALEQDDGKDDKE